MSVPPVGPRPPRLWTVLARVFVRGDDALHIRNDLVEAFEQDLGEGFSEAEARRRFVWNTLGSIGSVWTGGLRRFVSHGTLLDVRIAIRLLGKQPLLTVVAMLALGLGIPGSLVIHHGMGVFVHPLPLPEGDRLFGVRNWDIEARRPQFSSLHEYELWKEELASFQDIGAVLTYSVNVHTGDPGAPPVRGSQITASAFELLRVAPLEGRLFGPEDEAPGAPNVAIISERLWEARLTSDPDIVGNTIRIGRNEHTVVGIMPDGFFFPYDDDIWLPLRSRAIDYAPGEGPRFIVFGRLADEVSRDEADLEVARLTQQLAASDPQTYQRLIGQAAPMPVLFLGEAEIVRSDPEIMLFQSVMFIFLLIVCGNVGTLILARTATRMGEISVRTALGASRARILSQLFIEALVLAFVATGLGLLFAEMSARWLLEMAKRYEPIPYWMDFTLRPSSVVVAMSLAVVCAVVAGLLPALKATRSGVHANLQRSAGGGTTIRFGLGSSILIVGEVILSVGFLAMGGALVRSAFQDPMGQLGFEPESFLRATIEVPLADPGFVAEETDATRLTVAEIQRSVLEDIRSEPGVRNVATALHLPGAMLFRSSLHFESFEPEPSSDPISAGSAYVDADFFRDLDRPILAGRDFTADDVAPELDDHRPSVIVNTTFVEQRLEGRNAVGQRFRHVTSSPVPPDEHEWYEIVGVVDRFGTNPINPEKDAAIYHPLAPGEVNPVRYFIELDGDPAAFVPRFREVVAAVDPEVVVTGALPVVEIIEAQGGLYRWIFGMQVVLAAVAFLLSVTGLYALMSFTVSQRTREIGIRTALGARTWEIVSTIARRAAIQLGIGLSLGAVLTWFLLGEIANDVIVKTINFPVVIGGTTVLAALVGVIACLSPMLRGLRIEPTDALREL